MRRQGGWAMWWRVGAVLGAVVLAAGVGVHPATAATPPSRWSHDGYGPGNSGYNPDESVVNTSTIATLKDRWTVTRAAGEPGCEPSPRPPLVVDGRVFVLDGGGVAAYSVATGKRLWLNTRFSFISAGLVVANGLVLVSDTNCYSNSNYDGTVTALDAVTGRQRWSSRGSWMIDTVVADAGVMVTSGYCGTCDGFEHGVAAFRLTDGKELWSRDNTVLAGPVAAGARVMLSRSTRPGAEVVSIKTGAMTWGLGAATSVAAANPAGDTFYLHSSSGLRAVKAATGTPLWQVNNEAGVLAADGRRVYVASANRINTYHAATGKLLWTRAVNAPGRPIRAGRLLYTVTRAGALAILSPTNGKTAASGAAYTGLTGHVVAAGGRLFTVKGPVVRAYAPRSGKVI